MKGKPPGSAAKIGIALSAIALLSFLVLINLARLRQYF